MSRTIELKNEDKKTCTMHIVKVNGIQLHIMQHKSGSVSMNVHGMGSGMTNRISLHDVKVTKRMKRVGSTAWTSIEVVE